MHDFSRSKKHIKFFMVPITKMYFQSSSRVWVKESIVTNVNSSVTNGWFTNSYKDKCSRKQAHQWLQ
jgi:hypothetical protein